jgi:spore coat polysaccharide biosynthesis protein SpsF (cytidylyltransferase family)
VASNEAAVSPRVVCGIQARLGSTRLPAKVLADLAGEPLIVRVVERVRAARSVDAVVVVTSEDASDDPLADALAARGIEHLRGPLADVYARYERLMDAYRPDYVVRVTGDCPLVEPAFLDLQLAALHQHDCDLAVVQEDGIEGTLGGQTALSARALRSVASSVDPRDREHVGTFWFVEHRARFRNVGIVVDPAFRRPELRLQVDEPADLARMRAIFDAFAPTHGSVFPVLDVLRWLDAHPDVRDANAAVVESDDNRALRARRRAVTFPLVARHP